MLLVLKNRLIILTHIVVLVLKDSIGIVNKNFVKLVHKALIMMQLMENVLK